MFFSCAAFSVLRSVDVADYGETLLTTVVVVLIVVVVELFREWIHCRCRGCHVRFLAAI